MFNSLQECVEQMMIFTSADIVPSEIFSQISLLSYNFPVRTVAYIDPATTGQLIAIITGAVLSCGITLGILRTKIIMFFQKIKISRMGKKIIKEIENNKDKK